MEVNNLRTTHLVWHMPVSVCPLDRTFCWSSNPLTATMECVQRVLFPEPTLRLGSFLGRRKSPSLPFDEQEYMLDSSFLPTQDKSAWILWVPWSSGTNPNRNKTMGCLRAKVAGLLWHNRLAFPCLCHLKEPAIMFIISGQSRNECL